MYLLVYWLPRFPSFILHLESVFLDSSLSVNHLRWLFSILGFNSHGYLFIWKNQDGLIALLPRVVDLVHDRDIPVVAAGGIVDERGYVAALALGAHGVALGTRFELSCHLH